MKKVFFSLVILLVCATITSAQDEFSNNKRLTVYFQGNTDGSLNTTLTWSDYEQWRSDTDVSGDYQDWTSQKNITIDTSNYCAVHKAVKQYLKGNKTFKYFTRSELKRFCATVASYMEKPKHFTGQSLKDLRNITMVFHYNHGKLKQVETKAGYNQNGVVCSTKTSVTL